jgi:hypothetical protein
MTGATNSSAGYSRAFRSYVSLIRLIGFTGLSLIQCANIIRSHRTRDSGKERITAAIPIVRVFFERLFFDFVVSCSSRPATAELPRLSSVRSVYWRDTCADNAISKAISDRDKGICYAGALCFAV